MCIVINFPEFCIIWYDKYNIVDETSSETPPILAPDRPTFVPGRQFSINKTLNANQTTLNTGFPHPDAWVQVTVAGDNSIKMRGGPQTLYFDASDPHSQSWKPFPQTDSGLRHSEVSFTTPAALVWLRNNGRPEGGVVIVKPQTKPGETILHPANYLNTKVSIKKKPVDRRELKITKQ